MSLAYYSAQYSGLALALLCMAVLFFGYDSGYMENFYVCVIAVVLGVIALVLHETRPYNREEIMMEIREEKALAAQEKKSK